MNPFRQTVVADPWDTPNGDVAAIHRHVFDECLRGLSHVRESGHSAALLIHGAAGSGKTHLLRRLRQWLSLKQPTASDREEALFVWVRLQTSPRMIWRTVRRTLVTDWFRPMSESHSQFNRILFHRLAEYRVAEGDLEPWYEYMLQEDPQGLRDLIDNIATMLQLDRNTHVAFEHLAFGRHRRELQAWLAGESLPEAALERLELTQDEGTDEDREDQARQVILMLCRLAGDKLPIVLSFDQVEALELTPGDNDSLFAFGQLVSTLHDGTSNLLIISSVQSSFADRLNDHARAADRDRMRSLGSLSLAPLTREEARALIQARLQAAGEETSGDGPTTPLWPLSPEEADTLFSDPVTPRKLLSLCADRYEVLHNRPSPSSDNGLDQVWESTYREKLRNNQPALTEEILRYSLPTVVKLIHPDVKQAFDDRLGDVGVILEHPGGRLGISICTQAHMTSLSARLRRLIEQFGTRRIDGLLIVRDHRIPITKGAAKVQSRLEELEGLGARVVFPSVDVLAALDVIRSLLSDAKSGDLACDGTTIDVRTLNDWLATHLPKDVRAFLAKVVGQDED